MIQGFCNSVRKQESDLHLQPVFLYLLVLLPAPAGEGVCFVAEKKKNSSMWEDLTYELRSLSFFSQPSLVLGSFRCTAFVAVIWTAVDWAKTKGQQQTYSSY